MTLVLALFACRPEIGPPDYPDRVPWVRDDAEFYGDPLVTGEERLSIGVFYEGAATETMIIDDVATHFYVYESTFTDKPTDDRWEGYIANELVNAGKGWWGGGVHWDTAKDLSAWETLHLVARSDVVTDFEFGLNGGGTEAKVSAASLGFVADDEWHVLEVPLTAFAGEGANLSAVTVGLVLVGAGGAAGDAVVIDGVYYRSLP